MAADRILFLRHEFDCYDDCYENFDCYLADALISVEQSSDSFAQEFAKKHCTILSTILSVLKPVGFHLFLWHVLLGGDALDGN